MTVSTSFVAGRVQEVIPQTLGIDCRLLSVVCIVMYAHSFVLYV